MHKANSQNTTLKKKPSSMQWCNLMDENHEDQDLNFSKDKKI